MVLLRGQPCGLCNRVNQHLMPPQFGVIIPNEQEGIEDEAHGCLNGLKIAAASECESDN